MKLYNQKGVWGQKITLQQFDEMASLVVTEEDGFTVELGGGEKAINIEISLHNEGNILEVYVYRGPSIEPEIYLLSEKEISTFVLGLMEL